MSSGDRPGESPEIGPDAEVTINGGAAAPYPAAVWSASQIEDSAGVARAGIVGVAVGGVTSVHLMSGAGDSLQILSQTATALTVALPSQLSTDETLVLESGQVRALAVSPLGVSNETDAAPDYTMRPAWPYRAKDFAFVFGGGHFHLFYIRHDQTAPPDSTERDFGHAISIDLHTWYDMPSVMPVRPGKFDELHVWAPTILAQDGTCFMYYTGVKNVPYAWNWYQQIGVATSDIC